MQTLAGLRLLFLIVFLTCAGCSSAWAAEVRVPVWLLPVAIPLLMVSSGAFWTVRRVFSPDVCTVWYATNRKAVFGTELSDKLIYGTCRVAVPAAHKIGSVGSSPIIRLWQRIRTGADDRMYIIHRAYMWSEQEFVRSLAKPLETAGNDLLVYIHGYNVNFENAIIRAAQIGFDLKISGATVAFCWPSQGDLLGYAADSVAIERSEDQLAEFLSLLHQNYGDCKINILAHSMGNRGLFKVLRNLPRYPNLANVKFGQIFLAAPDVDADMFKSVAAIYPLVSARTTLYVCARDAALMASGSLFRGQRVGYAPPVTIVPGIDTVDASQIVLDRLGHGYYAEAFNVLTDMYYLLRTNFAPSKRQGLVEMKLDSGEIYWAIRPAHS